MLCITLTAFFSRLLFYPSRANTPNNWSVRRGSYALAFQSVRIEKWRALIKNVSIMCSNQLCAVVCRAFGWTPDRIIGVLGSDGPTHNILHQLVHIITRSKSLLSVFWYRSWITSSPLHPFPMASPPLWNSNCITECRICRFSRLFLYCYSSLSHALTLHLLLLCFLVDVATGEETADINFYYSLEFLQLIRKYLIIVFSMS